MNWKAAALLLFAIALLVPFGFQYAIEVTVSDGKLFAQGTQQQKIEFHPASETRGQDDGGS